MISVVRLTHYSIQEHLEGHRDRILLPGHAIIAELSMSYLLFDVFALGCRQDELEIESVISDNAFIKYAAVHWEEHVQIAKDNRIDALAKESMQAKPQMAFCVQVNAFLLDHGREHWEPAEAENYHMLLFAARNGLERVV